MILKHIIAVIAVMIIFMACHKTSDALREKRPSEFTSCQLIEKNIIKKNGESAGFKELYLRCSVQDYFIKLCESDVSANELRSYIGKGITVKMEIKDGTWDICPGDPLEMQSRIGIYAVIKEIVQ